MALNLAEEIKAVEADSKKRIADAKVEAVRLQNSAANEAEQKLKNAKQNAFKKYRECVSKVEREADERAQNIVEAGRENAAAFSADHKGRITQTATWIAEEVIARYGRS